MICQTISSKACTIRQGKKEGGSFIFHSIFLPFVISEASFTISVTSAFKESCIPLISVLQCRE